MNTYKIYSTGSKTTDQFINAIKRYGIATTTLFLILYLSINGLNFIDKRISAALFTMALIFIGVLFFFYLSYLKQMQIKGILVIYQDAIKIQYENEEVLIKPNDVDIRITSQLRNPFKSDNYPFYYLRISDTNSSKYNVLIKTTSEEGYDFKKSISIFEKITKLKKGS